MIEHPLKSVIRFGVPVVDSKGKKHGILIVNFLGKLLIEDFRLVSSIKPGHSYLLNHDGYFIIGHNPEEEWGFIFEERKDESVRNEYPGLWEEISNKESGQLITTNGMFTFMTFYPLLEVSKWIAGKGEVERQKSVSPSSSGRGNVWKVVSHIPVEVLHERANNLLARIIPLYILVVLLFGIVSWYLARNISQRINVEEKRKEDGRFLNTVLHSMEEGLLVIDVDYRIQMANQFLLKMLKRTKDEVVGRHCYNLIHKRDEVCEDCAARETFKTGKPASVCHSGIAKDGSHTHVELTTFPIFNSEGGVKQVVEKAVDISERMRKEEEIKRHSAKMENALSRAEDVLNLLSKPPNAAPFFVASPMYRTTRTIGGGDTIRWVDFRSRYAGIYLHDVSGHAIQETLLNILAVALTDLHKTNPGKKTASVPSIFLKDMNKELCMFIGDTHHYITAIYLLMDFNTREIKYSLAGHPMPWLISPVGSGKQIGTQGFMMGQFEISLEGSDRYRDSSIMLKSGETLLVYSDGLMEQKNSEQVEFEDRFKKNILPRLSGLEPEDAYQLLKMEFEAHLGGNAADDDVSFIFIGCRPEEKYKSFKFIPSRQMIASFEEHKSRVGNIEAGDESGSQKDFHDVGGKPGCKVVNDVAESYEQIINELSEEGWPKEKIKQVEVALGEMVVNAIMHGNLLSNKYSVEIDHVIHNNVLEVSVSDEGKGFDGSSLSQVIDDEDLMMERGRGLHMISLYVDKIYFNDIGNKCWAIFKK